MKRRPVTGHAAAAILLAAYWAMAVTAAAGKSSTFDEPDHVTSGYSQWVHHDYRLEPASRALPNRWAALPLLAMDLRFPALDGPEWTENRRDLLTERFLYDAGNDPDRILRGSRGAMALLGVALGWLTYAWSLRLFGQAGAFLSLGLFCFCPTMLAHGALASSDVAFALFLLLFATCFWSVLHVVTPPRLLASALAASALLLTKASGLLVLPLAALLLVLRLLAPGKPAPWPRLRFRARDREVRGARRILAVIAAVAAVHVLVAAAAIWTAYGFRYSAFNPALPGRHVFLMPWEQVLDTYGPARPAVEFVRRHRLLPEGWLHGLSLDLKSTEARPAFLDGEYSLTGWRGFFPYAVAVKTPLPLFAVLLLAAIATLRRLASAGDRRGAVFDALHATAPLWAVLAVVWGFAIASHLNIGHRHVLAAYPPAFVLAGAAAAAGGRRILAGLAALALVLFAGASLRIRPHYLAYFNLLAGGPSEGYRHLVDSSLDWGQDLPSLAAWLERNAGGGVPVYLSYFGSARPEHYGIRAVLLPGKRPSSFFGGSLERGPVEIPALAGGIYCISATMLQRVYTTPAGPWTAAHDALYRDLHARRDALRDDVERQRYVDLRFVRLCTRLLQREPDASAGYSILIYRLTDEDVRQALE
jgi:hypothetical protein